MQSMKQILATLFKTKPEEQQRMDTEITPTPAAESTPLQSAPIETTPLSKMENAAKEFFARRPHVEQVAMIETLKGGTEADVTIIDKAIGKRITARLAVNDHLEANALDLATRFSNVRTETVHC